jgi:transcriptional regulator with XRE-family HTH domain
MSKSKKQALSNYVERIMKEKHLSRRDVKLRSGGEITDSYVSGIISGNSTNLSVDKLKALARGLRVPEMELIRAAFDLDAGEDTQAADESHNLLLLDITNKVFLSNDLAEIISELLKLTPSDRRVVLQYIKRLGRTERRTQRRRKLA